MTPPTVDLSNCDREPIHIPGAVQPHGVLLACRGPAFTIGQASENAGALLGAPVEALELFAAIASLAPRRGGPER